jgi:predicted Zn finger-like uncharacterized protein
MEITCPHCDYSGTIQDGLIPESGSAVNCPKCKKKFFVTPDIPEMEADDMMTPTVPLTAGQGDAPAAAIPERRKGLRRRQDTVKTVFVAFGLIFGMFLCFIAGRISVGSNPLAPPTAPGKPAGPTGPAGPKPAGGPSVAGGLPADLPLIVLPEERFVGAETVNISEVDKNISGISALTDPEKTTKMSELAGDLIGKNVTGTFKVVKVEKVLFFFDAFLPEKTESRYLEGEADTKSPVHARIFLTVSGKGPELSAIEKTSKVFVTGFIASCRASDVLELGLNNAQVKAAR